jgi:hypothetical protein
MGAWDATVFGNDDAADWAGELVDANDEQLVSDALRRAVEADYLESFQGGRGASGARSCAAAAGRPTLPNSYNERALVWAAARPGLVELAPLAMRAVQRVLAEDSERQDLWQEAGHPAWAEAARDLLGRLR